MTFQIHALAYAPFAPLFELSDDDLQARKACRVTVADNPGAPCRVSLDEAAIGEIVLLVNHASLAEPSPYQASHAIYVHEGVAQARPAPGVIPATLERRVLSVRGFTADNMMITGDVMDGRDLAPALTSLLARDDIAQVHMHYAGRGCFAARATRAVV